MCRIIHDNSSHWIASKLHGAKQLCNSTHAIPNKTRFTIVLIRSNWRHDACRYMYRKVRVKYHYVGIARARTTLVDPRAIARSFIRLATASVYLHSIVRGPIRSVSISAAASRLEMGGMLKEQFVRDPGTHTYTRERRVIMLVRFRRGRVVRAFNARALSVNFIYRCHEN